MSASIWAPGSDIINIDAESSNLSQVFTATASQTVFNLTSFSYTVGGEGIAVYRNGQRLIKGVDWSETSSTSISLVGITVAAGEVIEVVAVLGAASDASIDAAASAAAADAARIAAEAAAASINPSSFATAAQGVTADSALQPDDIGVTVQPYDVDTAKTDVAQNFTVPQRSAILTDNDGSFDLSAKQNFKCTTAGSVTLTFTNQADGLSGSVILVNASNHTVSAHANTKISSTALARISATGTYRIDYISDGTSAYCTASENLT
jgi:hypothetical protein